MTTPRQEDALKDIHTIYSKLIQLRLELYAHLSQKFYDLPEHYKTEATKKNTDFAKNLTTLSSLLVTNPVNFSKNKETISKLLRTLIENLDWNSPSYLYLQNIFRLCSTLINLPEFLEFKKEASLDQQAENLISNIHSQVDIFFSAEILAYLSAKEYHGRHRPTSHSLVAFIKKQIPEYLELLKDLRKAIKSYYSGRSELFAMEYTSNLIIGKVTDINNEFNLHQQGLSWQQPTEHEQHHHHHHHHTEQAETTETADAEEGEKKPFKYG